MWGVSAADFVRDLAAIDAPEITVRINSPGGSVFDGIAILNALRGHDATDHDRRRRHRRLDRQRDRAGRRRVVMNKNSTMMIHNAWDVASVTPTSSRKRPTDCAAVLGQHRQHLRRQGRRHRRRLAGLMDAETWYTADEAVAAGLADESIVETSRCPVVRPRIVRPVQVQVRRP
jgi:ATP-dependent protease ClpP protease subunit